ncbi:6-carboxyhexanoate--CoA ligase [Bacillus sp. FJAT-45350]|uniref:6-carboxyhexanoate--CoA ligase n=1 Tax=Bacillus sp. FJAT-45350 TaxID=2011014 RepID=UPI000BB95DC1|nr:6-carboxyhexanoate--CoA ligase [Bacillus sp. FJAT-45350]
MENKLFSIRMRAAKGGSHENGGKHISGGEVLANYENIKKAVNTLMDKALMHSRGNPDFMLIQFEEVQRPVRTLRPLPIQTNNVSTTQEGHLLAKRLLKECGVSGSTIERAYELIAKPENIGMRGAMLLTTSTGERVDNRGEKGVRVSRMDWEHSNFKKWAMRQELSSNLRVKEAITLATKVANHPGIIAELCWSDDPDYITGYVASEKIGYHRISKLKEYGDERGFRIFFVKEARNIENYIDYLEKDPILLFWEEEDDKRFNY